MSRHMYMYMYIPPHAYMYMCIPVHTYMCVYIVAQASVLSIVP